MHYCCFYLLVELPVKLTKNLQNRTVQELDSVTLECELSKPGQTVTWLYNGKPLKTDNRVIVKASGKRHSLTFSKVLLEDMGEYTVNTGSVESKSKLVVKGTLLSFLMSLISAPYLTRYYQPGKIGR